MHHETPDNPTPSQPPEMGAPPPHDGAGSAMPPDSGPVEYAFIDERNLAPRECTFSLALPEAEDERRRAGRFPVERVQCDQGRVRDLSRTGVRLDRRGRLSADRPVPIMMSDGELVVAIECDIRWERKLGFMKWEYGLEFRELPEADARVVARIAANCREQRKLIRRPA